jgi:hypothetical protein
VSVASVNDRSRFQIIEIFFVNIDSVVLENARLDSLGKDEGEGKGEERLIGDKFSR